MVPAWWDVLRGHEVASKIEYEIEQALGNRMPRLMLSRDAGGLRELCGQSSGR